MHDLLLVSTGDMAAIVAAAAAVGLLIGGMLGWLLRNERRISSLEANQEQSEKKYNLDITSLRAAVEATHARLDAYFLGTGPRSKG